MRKLVIINSFEIPFSFPFSKGGIFLPNNTSTPFSNAKSLLGNEYPFAIYDMRTENGVNFNLDAFAIVAGTIQRGGVLYLLCDDWENVAQAVDFDSVRWNDDRAIATPMFWRFFKKLVEKYQFECRGVCHTPQYHTPQMEMGVRRTSLQLNTDQQFILKNLPLDPADIHLITAPRGRGKSTLSGKLAEMITADHSVIITARARAALPNFWKQIENDKVQFFAPDRLIQAVESGENFANHWLFIDEAASLPLPMLQKLCADFGKVIMTTTSQNYEGTGRGFELKLPKMLNQAFRHWTLSQPLRWNENDPLENFVNDLLLLSPFSKNVEGQASTLSKGEKLGEGVKSVIEFYDLLSTAHYKTTPTDLRRLFDGKNQQLFDIRENRQLAAGCWAVNEGGLGDELTQAIWRGERRPKGSLVAQYLCFQGNLPQACRFRSLRISRIAVQPEMQGKGYGKRLISNIILQLQDKGIKPLAMESGNDLARSFIPLSPPLSKPLDFLSVSFGMSDELLHFWQQCGFRLVQISQNKEASSGLYSAMMIYPLSAQGKDFAKLAERQFLRDQHLQKNGEKQPLDESDWQNIYGFIHHQRTFSACRAALQRLYQHDSIKFSFLNKVLRAEKMDKAAIKMLKANLLQWLE